MSDTGTPPEFESDALSVSAASALVDRIVDNVETVIVGQHDTVEHILVAMLARGHVLLEDVPGVGKTMLARAVAASVGGTFKRVQFTPDLLPSDVTGVNVFNQKTREFEFRPGPVFGNVVLADEINRAPPKTQSALLEAMEEEQVTVDGETRTLPTPFTVIATQNDVDTERTYELPVAELDRFMKYLRMGYPDQRDETELLGRVAGGHPIDSLDTVADIEEFRRAQETVASIDARTPIRSYITRLASYTREHAALGISPRGNIALLRAAQARAMLNGREYVIPDDVQAEVSSVWTHRIRTEPDGPDAAQVAAAALDNTNIE